MDDIRRGEIFYIARGGATNGSEQFADRPAVVVSNDENNKHSGVIEVVYMTTQPKTDLPTHVTVRSTGRLSTVLCEQVSSVSTDRVNNYIGQVSEQEMKNIDIALMISLQLSGGGKTSKQYNETIQKQQEEIEYYRNKIQAMQQSLEEKETEKPQEAAGEASETVVRLETERDTYKALYEQLFERMLNGGTGKWKKGN
jgi:mRNA interferase MazF